MDAAVIRFGAPPGRSSLPAITRRFRKGMVTRPVPPGQSKHPEVRYLDIKEADTPDDARVAEWIRQAAALPGWVP